MATSNRISVIIPNPIKLQILAKLLEVKTSMSYLVNLTMEERRGMAHLGTSRGAMDQTFAQQMAAHPEWVPGYVDLTELEADRALRSTLFEILARVAELASGLEDTAMVAGADIYTAYLAFYANVKEAAKRGVPGAQAVLDDLKRFFPRGRSSSSTPPASQP